MTMTFYSLSGLDGELKTRSARGLDEDDDPTRLEETLAYGCQLTQRCVVFS